MKKQKRNIVDSSCDYVNDILEEEQELEKQDYCLYPYDNGSEADNDGKYLCELRDGRLQPDIIQTNSGGGVIDLTDYIDSKVASGVHFALQKNKPCHFSDPLEVASILDKEKNNIKSTSDNITIRDNADGSMLICENINNADNSISFIEVTITPYGEVSGLLQKIKKNIHTYNGVKGWYDDDMGFVKISGMKHYDKTKEHTALEKRLYHDMCACKALFTDVVALRPKNIDKYKKYTKRY
jgi:hypothetical protein